MHASSLENMQKCLRRYVLRGPLANRERLSVLDVGGADLNGSFRQVFSDPRFDYVAADLQPGEGVGLVLEDPYSIPLPDRSVDVVLSGQVLEHCEFFWLSFAEMMRVLKDDGLVFLIVPSAGPEHRFPVDCYRFYPDALKALARYAGCALIDSWLDPRGPWKDLVGVYAHAPVDLAAFAAPASEPAPQPRAAPPEGWRSAPEEEAVAGARGYRLVLADIHELLQPRRYLEIGVRKGGSFALSACPSVGVDPFPELKRDLPPDKQVVAMTSDDFFDGPADQVLAEPPDLVLIDGMHLFEFALRDFMNVEARAAPHTVVILDDVLPNHPAQAERERRTAVWTGDVWKLVEVLRRRRPDLHIALLDTEPAGMALICGLDRTNRVLWDRYNGLVKDAERMGAPPEAVLTRADALQADRARLEPILQVMRQARETGIKPARIVAALNALAAAPKPKAAPLGA